MPSSLGVSTYSYSSTLVSFPTYYKGAEAEAEAEAENAYGTLSTCYTYTGETRTMINYELSDQISAPVPRMNI